MEVMNCLKKIEIHIKVNAMNLEIDSLIVTKKIEILGGFGERECVRERKSRKG